MRFSGERPNKIIKKVGENEHGFPYIEFTKNGEDYNPDHNFTLADGEEVLKRIAGGKISRRDVIRGSASVAAAAATGYVAGELLNTKDAPQSPENVDANLERSRAFMAEVSGYREQVKLRADEVLFVDSSGTPVAVVKMEDFVVDRVNEKGETFQYLLTPGNKNEDGILEGSIAGEWLDYIRETKLAQLDGVEIDTKNNEPRALTVYQQFRQALNDTDEPVLAEKIRTGEIATFEEIIRYFSEKPTVEEPTLTRREYVQQKIQFRRWQKVLDENGEARTNEKGEVFMRGVHPAAAAELRRLIPGLCAQESNFNNDLESYAGAIRIFQILKIVLEKDYNFSAADFEEFAKLSNQVKIAGEHISRGYERLRSRINPLAMEQMERLHGSEDIFQREIMVPLTINGYNAGPDRIAAAVNKYFEQTENREKRLLGRDLFLDIIDFARNDKEDLLAGYGQHAREYTTRIYAKADIFSD